MSIPNGPIQIMSASEYERRCAAAYARLPWHRKMLLKILPRKKTGGMIGLIADTPTTETFKGISRNQSETTASLPLPPEAPE